MVLFSALVFLCLSAAVNCVNVELLRPYDHTANQMFVAADKDANNIMSLAELSNQLSLYDINHDGHVSRHEYTEYTCRTTPALYHVSHYLFDQYDVHSDNKLTSVDYQALYDKMDTNDDGVLTHTEYTSWWVKTLTNLEGLGQHYHGHSHEHGSAACH